MVSDVDGISLSVLMAVETSLLQLPSSSNLTQSRGLREDSLSTASGWALLSMLSLG